MAFSPPSQEISEHDMFLNWAEKMRVPLHVLPKKPESLFNKPETSFIWRDIISLVKPKHEVQAMRRNILLHQNKQHKEGKLPYIHTEIKRWKNRDTLRTKLKEAHYALESVQQKVQRATEKATDDEKQRDEFIGSIEESKTKTEFYNKKASALQFEMAMYEKLKGVVESVRPVTRKKEISQEEAMKSVTNCINEIRKVKEIKTSEGNNLNERLKVDLNNFIESVVLRISSKTLWSIFVDLVKQISDKMGALVTSVNLESNRKKIRNGKSFEEGHAKLCSANIQSVIRNSQYELRLNEHISRLGDLNESLKTDDIILVHGTDSDERIRILVDEYIGIIFRHASLCAKLNALKHEVQKINSLCEDERNVEKESEDIIEKIRKVDRNVDQTVSRIQHNTLSLEKSHIKLEYLQKLANSKISEVGKSNDSDNNASGTLSSNATSVTSGFGTFDSPSSSINSDHIQLKMHHTKEIELFGRLNIRNLKKITLKNGQRKCVDDLFVNSFIQTDYLPVKLLKLCQFVKYIKGLESINTSLSTDDLDKFKTQRDLVLKQTITNVPDFTRQISDMCSVQTDIEYILQCIKENIDFWYNNPLDKYISSERTYKGKMYFEYKEMLLQFSKYINNSNTNWPI